MKRRAVVFLALCAAIISAPSTGKAATCELTDRYGNPCIFPEPLKAQHFQQSGRVHYQARIRNRCNKAVAAEWKFTGKRPTPDLIGPGGKRTVNCVAPEGCTGPLEYAVGVCPDGTKHHPAPGATRAKPRPREPQAPPPSPRRVDLSGVWQCPESQQRFHCQRVTCKSSVTLKRVSENKFSGPIAGHCRRTLDPGCDLKSGYRMTYASNGYFIVTVDGQYFDYRLQLYGSGLDAKAVRRSGRKRLTGRRDQFCY